MLVELVCGNLMESFGYKKSIEDIDEDKAINLFKNDTKIETFYSNWKNNRVGVEEFPADPLDKSTWGVNFMGNIEDKGEVLVVHAIDTEGPLYSLFNAKFDRLNESLFNINHIEQTKENLIKLQNGEIKLEGVEKNTRSS